MQNYDFDEFKTRIYFVIDSVFSLKLFIIYIFRLKKQEICLYIRVMKKYLSLVFIFVYISIYSQQATLLYIEKYSDLAISEMKLYNIPASITLAQGILESGNGSSRLAVEGKNHFGIKCHGWKGQEIYADDDEENECFRKYDNVKESFRDHSEFLVKNKRYSFLFDLDDADYISWSKGLQTAGYATSKTYSDKLINIIERYNLYEFDNSLKKSERKIFLTQSYGFPFLFAAGISYFNKDKYIVDVRLKSSFVINGVESSYSTKVSNNIYAGFSILALHRSFQDPNSKLDFAFSPKMSYFLDLKNKDIFIDLGLLFLFDDPYNLRNQRYPLMGVSITYLIK